MVCLAYCDFNIHPCGACVHGDWMTSLLIPFHVLTGVAGSLLPFLIILELTKSFKKISVKKIRIVAALSLIFLVLSWIIGGLYYVNVYGSTVKPAIQKTQPWIHAILMESKEHIFLFMPFLAALMNVLVWIDLKKSSELIRGIALMLTIFGLYMVVAGWMITSARVSAGVVV